MLRGFPAITVWHRVSVLYLGAMLIGNAAWETLHLPLYTLWETNSASYLAFVVAHCTVGDLMIAAATLFVATTIAGRDWPRRNYGRVALITILFGLAYTVFSEWLNVSVRGSWAYAPTMPVVPMLGTGLSSILQWIVVPAASFVWVRSRKTLNLSEKALPQRELE